MAEHTFTVNTENHVADIPGIGKFEFQPEAYSDELLEARARWTTASNALAQISTDEKKALTDKQVEALTAATREANVQLRAFIGDLMTPESRESFAMAKLPDRTIIELLNWILGVYGLRPTTSSSDSSEPSATTPASGSDSTADSPTEESTP